MFLNIFQIHIKSHSEFYRVLKRGGRHIFTVPFNSEAFVDERRAELIDGKVNHILGPMYHMNPVDQENGALVYNIFSLEMLTRMSAIGVKPAMLHMYAPEAGIIGPNALVFEAIKP